MVKLGNKMPDRRRLCVVDLKSRHGITGDVLRLTITDARLQDNGAWRYPGGYYITHPEDEWDYVND